MDDTGAQIEELKREVALLRGELARSDAKMLTCLVRAEARILACQTDLAVLKDSIKRDAAAKGKDRAAPDAIVKEEFGALWKRAREIEGAVAEIQLFIGPVVERLFPNLLKAYVAVGEKFKATGTYSEAKRD